MESGASAEKCSRYSGALAVVADVLVELLVVLVGDLALDLVQSACTVFTALPFSSIGNWHEIRVMLDDLLDARRRRKLRLAQVEHDARAALQSLAGSIS